MSSVSFIYAFAFQSPANKRCGCVHHKNSEQHHPSEYWKTSGILTGNRQSPKDKTQETAAYITHKNLMLP